MARTPSNFGGSGRYPIWTNIHDLMTRMARAYRNIKILDETCAKLDSGNGGTEFPDGQIFTGNQYLYDSLAQDSNYVWIQDSDTFDFGGVIILDYDIQSGTPPAETDIVSVFGLSENPEQLGTKTTGVFFTQPTYKPYIGSAYDGNVQFQSLNIPITSGGPVFQWPQADGPAGGTLTTDGSGGLYWTDPATPPAQITDTDTTDVSIVEALAWTAIPVTVTATQPSIPAQISLDISYWSGNNNQILSTRMLIDGTPSGAVFNTALPRNAIIDEHFTWSPTLPNGNEVITVEVQKVGGQACWIYGATGDPTVLTLLEPGGLVALSAGVQNTDYIIGPLEFWNRWSVNAQENLAKFLNHQPLGGAPPAWLDVARVTVFVALYSAQNVNLLDQQTIDNINELVTLGVLTPAEAAIILAV